MPRKKTAGTGGGSSTTAVTSIKYPAKRKNIPPAGLEAHGVVQEEEVLQYAFNPHLPPALRSSPDPAKADDLPRLVAKARQGPLTEDEAKTLADALRRHEPWLEWSGKRERPWFEVDPVALHMHERVSTQAILRVLEREDIERDLFADPQHDYAKAVQFYQHDVDWANRMILGDSLQVMASLARREDLAGKVQMIYIDPPYGIKFSSNFQPELGQRDVKDRPQDLTREPEMVKAYRDTWTLGVHSYLAYLRDRLAMARELLSDKGSIFVQIGEENLHRVRCIMDEIFGADNSCSIIPFVTTSSQTSEFLATTFDFLIWYAKDKRKLKFRHLYKLKERNQEGGTKYRSIELDSGERGPISDLTQGVIPVTSKIFRPSPMVSQSGGENSGFSVYFNGKERFPRSGYWKTNKSGIERLIKSERIVVEGRSIAYVRYLNDFPVFPVSAFWDDTWGVQSRSDPKQYVVQTSSQVIERCLLMATDPGDLVLDPTCGSGTTALVAEHWGRRWITIDTSRVALALAKQRLMTAMFNYYRLCNLDAEDLERNPDGAWIAQLDSDGQPTGSRCTFYCKTVPHITLKSIARNTSLDPIFEQHEPILADALESLNQVVNSVDANQKEALVAKLIEKHRRDGANSVTDADVRRWLLPGADPAQIRPVGPSRPLKAVTQRQASKYRDRIPDREWQHWQVPFDTDPDWPQPLREALDAYRTAWRAKMDEVNACIAANAETEELVDRPEIVKGTVRVAGPFTVEGVIPIEDGPDSPIGGAPDELEAFDSTEASSREVANVEAHLDKIIRLLRASGVDFRDNKRVKFKRLDPVTTHGLIHAEGEWLNGNGEERRVAVSIGPEVGNIPAWQVEEIVRPANRLGYDDVVFAGFGFDAAAQEVIQEAAHPSLRFHMALIRPDVAMYDLLATQPGSQIFTVFSAPRVCGPCRQDDGDYVVEVEGMDVYDPVSNILSSNDKRRIAAWFVDTDYDGRTFCICQAFFPDRKRWDKLARALGDKGAIDASAFDALSGFKSLPFARPAEKSPDEPWRIAVKVIDPRGNEGLRVLTVTPAT